jgi:hypothetical protein
MLVQAHKLTALIIQRTSIEKACVAAGRRIVWSLVRVAIVTLPLGCWRHLLCCVRMSQHPALHLLPSMLTTAPLLVLTTAPLLMLTTAPFLVPLLLLVSLLLLLLVMLLMLAVPVVMAVLALLLATLSLVRGTATTLRVIVFALVRVVLCADFRVKLVLASW